MEWLSQNWIWILLLIGFVLLMRRGASGGCDMGHARQATHQGGAHEMATTATSGGGSVADNRRAHRHQGC